MGIYCKIYLDKPPDGVYRAGGAVAGVVKYTLTKDKVFNSITVSLKGKGRCQFPNPAAQNQHQHQQQYQHQHQNQYQQKHQNQYQYQHQNHNIQQPPQPQVLVGNEQYVSIHATVPTGRTGEVAAGEYTAPFNFTLPFNIPATYRHETYSYKSVIVYYVRIKFSETGLFSFAKRFRSEITVTAGLIPTLPQEAIVYGIQKNLTTLFGSKKNSIDVKVTINKSMLLPSENAEIAFEVENNSKVDIPTIQTNIVRIITLRSDCGRSQVFEKVLQDYRRETEAIVSRSDAKLNTVLPMPNVAYTLQCSRIISREYKLVVTVKIPGFHRDSNLDVPILIGELMSNIVPVYPVPVYLPPPFDPPPTYWKAMAEEKKEE